MAKVKVFVYGRRRQQRRRRRRRRRRRGYDNSSPDFRHGELKTRKLSQREKCQRVQYYKLIYIRDNQIYSIST